MLDEPCGLLRGAVPDAHQCPRCARARRSRELHGRPVRDDAEAADGAVEAVGVHDPDANACVDTQTDEFYEINEDVPLPKLDRARDNLLDGRTLTPVQKKNYASLVKELALLSGSAAECEGDANLDRIVDAKDVIGWAGFDRVHEGKSSWYDVNLDGLTNAADLAIILQNYGTTCQSGGTQIRAAAERER